MQLKSNSFLQGGKYCIERMLGQGGFGITYLAVQVALNRKVAIKEFFMKEYCERDGSTSHVSLGTSGSRETVERFRQKFIKEAQNIACLNHPHIIRIHDVFEENGTAYYVMEYWDNGSLADLVKKQGKLSEAEALKYIRQVADALSYIHERKMIHLDVKPGNILLDENRNAVLIDFGLSKRYDEEGKQTSTTPVGISHGYAPLEQYKKGGVGTFSPATDIYSLGATLYKLVTGSTPPDADVILNEGLPPLPANMSQSIADSIEATMQPINKKRPQSVEEFIELLEGEKIEESDNDENENTTIVAKVEKNPTFQAKMKQTPTTVSSSFSWKKWTLFSFLCIATVFAVIFWPKSEPKQNVVKQPRNVVEQSENDKRDSIIVSTEIVSTETVSSLLNVTTSPSGASVYVDGVKIGTTPIKDYEVDCGIRTIIIYKYGYEAFSKKMNFSDKRVNVREVLKAAEESEITRDDSIITLEKPAGLREATVVEQASKKQVATTVSSSSRSSNSTVGKAIDLGLSVKWADRNVGASSPSDYGDYFAWGETSTKSAYSAENSVTYEKDFSDIGGKSQYDAARANWGGSWRLPTKAECEELDEKCTWTWTTQGGHNGYKVTGPNGNSIFLPAAGFRFGSSLGNAGEYGYYLSSSPYESKTWIAYSLNFDSGGHEVGWSYRYNGHAVRPVSD